MERKAADKYVLFSLAATAIIILMCAVGSFSTNGANGNGMTEMDGIASDPYASQNGTVFRLTDLDGNEYRCFYRSALPEMPVLCTVTGSFSSDGNMFFVTVITVNGNW